MCAAIGGVDYSTANTPDGYTCIECGAGGVRLYRLYQTFNRMARGCGTNRGWHNLLGIHLCPRRRGRVVGPPPQISFRCDTDELTSP